MGKMVRGGVSGAWSLKMGESKKKGRKLKSCDGLNG